jgi:uncharacterized protein (DUF1501 family)
MNTNRRKFLTSTSALTAGALAGNLGTWGVESANAQAATGYRAMVCVFLFGGNDSNNMVIPFTDYAQYAAVRTAASNVALTQAQLIQFNAPSLGKAFGFHPSMMPTNTLQLAPLYTAGKLAVIANAGTLSPMTKAQYNSPDTGRRACCTRISRISITAADGARAHGWGGRMSTGSWALIPAR